MKASEDRPVKLTIHLSREGKNKLEELRLRALDKHSGKPSASEIIEALVSAALADEKIPYPTL
jgi:hypothetical protein